MKKSVAISIVIVLVVMTAAGIIGVSLFKNKETTDSFELADYNQYISDYNKYFPEEKKSEPVGYIGSSKDAKKVAEAIWKEIYGESTAKRKPYKTYFDKENQVWLVTGRAFFVAGDPNILIQKADGKILAVWHGKF